MDGSVVVYFPWRGLSTHNTELSAQNARLRTRNAELRFALLGGSGSRDVFMLMDNSRI